MCAENRIALFVPSMAGGGAEKFIMHIANGVVGEGMNCDLVLADAAGPYLSDVSPKVRVIGFGKKHVFSSSLPSLVRYLAGERPRVMLSALDHANITALVANRIAGNIAKSIITVHIAQSQSMKQSKLSIKHMGVRRLLLLTYPWADEIVCVSADAADDMARVTGIARSRIRVLYPPVVSRQLFDRAAEPVDHSWFKPPAPPVIVGMGRLMAQKDFPTLIKAFRKVRDVLDAHLYIVGQGEERGSLELLIRNLGLEKDAILAGYLENPYAYLGRAAVYANSSRWDAMPAVMIEALALGVPIVSTDCMTGPREILDGGRYGRLVPVGDADAMARMIIEAIKTGRTERDPDAARRFLHEPALAKYLDLIKNMSAGGRRA